MLLAVLNKAYPDHAPSLTDAAEVYGSSRQNVKQIALGLEARGFLHLVPDPGDGRTTLIERTGKERMFDEPDGQARAAAPLAHAFDGLSGRTRSLSSPSWGAGLAVWQRSGVRPTAGKDPRSRGQTSRRCRDDPRAVNAHRLRALSLLYLVVRDLGGLIHEYCGAAA